MVTLQKGKDRCYLGGDKEATSVKGLGQFLNSSQLLRNYPARLGVNAGLGFVAFVAGQLGKVRIYCGVVAFVASFADPKSEKPVGCPSTGREHGVKSRRQCGLFRLCMSRPVDHDQGVADAHANGLAHDDVPGFVHGRGPLFVIGNHLRSGTATPCLLLFRHKSQAHWPRAW